MDYQIGTQNSYPYAADFNPGQVMLNQSVMPLRFRLLHEEDLMRFMNALARVDRAARVKETPLRPQLLVAPTDLTATTAAGDGATRR